MSFEIPNRVIQEYSRNISNLYRFFVSKLKTMNFDEFISVLRSLETNDDFIKYTHHIASSMVQKVNIESEKGWREVMLESTNSRELYAELTESIRRKQLTETINESIKENVSFLKKIPSDIAENIVNKVNTETIKGIRASEMSKEINEYMLSNQESLKYRDVTELRKKVEQGLIKPKELERKIKQRADLIANTEVAKAQTVLMEARATSINKNWYVWRTQKMETVRPSHEYMEDIYINWNDPPDPESLSLEKGVKGVGKPYGNYHAGCTFNCHCRPAPVVSTKYLKYPVKVHRSGTIVPMSREEFEAIF